MKQTHFIIYYRTSNRAQSQVNLSLEIQQASVTIYVVNCNGLVDASYIEIESGRQHDRPCLSKALEECRLRNSTLLIAKCGRLSLNAPFLSLLQMAGVTFNCVDMPHFNEVPLKTLDLTEAIAEFKRSQKILAARRAAKVRRSPTNLSPEEQLAWRKACNQMVLTEKVNQANKIMPLISEIQSSGTLTLKGIAIELNKRGMRGEREALWTAQRLKRVLHYASTPQPR